MVQRVTILYGTETGNAEYCSDDIETALRAISVNCRVIDMGKYDFTELAAERMLMIVTSTYGNGDPPGNARAFMTHLKEKKPRVDGLPIAVLSLGDTSFKQFAQAGKDFEQLLRDLGAVVVVERVDCDLDYETDAEQFTESVVGYLEDHKDILTSRAPQSQPVATPDDTTAVSDAPQNLCFDRNRPFPATLLSRRRLTAQNSDKETYHYAIDLQGSGISYLPGDCFAVIPTNCPDEVSTILNTLNIDPECSVEYKGKTDTIARTLRQRCCLHNPSSALLRALANAGGMLAKNLLEDQDHDHDHGTRSAPRQYHVLDLLQNNPESKLNAQPLVTALRPLAPRFYSVASSQRSAGDEVHFTIDTVRYRHNDRAAKGVASSWLADRLQVGETLPCYLHENTGFRLPSDNRPIIMIGPGTGIAPFRAFLHEIHDNPQLNPRETWLFFGHRHKDREDLYGEELRRFLDDRTLSHLACAWSRDQDKKVYVQDLLHNEASTLWKLLEAGANIYVCGDAEAMAPAVHAALVSVAEEQGNIKSGESFLQTLEAEGRYQRDVY